MKARGLNNLSSGHSGSHSRKKKVKCPHVGRETWLGMTCLSCGVRAYTPDIELLLDGLQEPLSVVHTVDRRDAGKNYVKWMPAIQKEVGVIEKAVQRLAPEKVKEGGWLKRKEVKVVPCKLVFTCFFGEATRTSC